MYTLPNMPSLVPPDWACHQPPVSSPLRPSQTTNNGFFNSSPPGTPPQSSPIRASADRSQFLSVPAPAFNVGHTKSSPPQGANRYSRFADRQTKPMPVGRKREEEQATRRRLFMRNVRDRADDKRFEKRSIEAHAVRSWHEEHQQYLAHKAREAGPPDDFEMDAFIEDAISAQQPNEEEELPYMDFADGPTAAEIEYEAMMADMRVSEEQQVDGIPMSEWDMDDDVLLDLVKQEESRVPGNGGDDEMMM